MASKVLSPNEIALGRAVLLATDALDMHAEGAFWLYDKKDDEWRYFLVTSLFGRIDPREVYFCLNEAFAKILSQQESIDLRLYMAAPTEELIGELLKQVSTPIWVSEPKHVKVTINKKNTEAIVYRLAEKLATDKARKIQRKFRRSCREISAAA